MRISGLSVFQGFYREHRSSHTCWTTTFSVFSCSAGIYYHTSKSPMNAEAGLVFVAYARWSGRFGVEQKGAPHHSAFRPTLNLLDFCPVSLPFSVLSLLA